MESTPRIEQTSTTKAMMYPAVEIDVWCLIQVQPDGTVTRVVDFDHPPLFVPASASDPVPSVDVTLDPSTGLWARIYHPPVSTDKQLPLIVYVHGGGFCLFSPGVDDFHRLATRLASATSSIVLSVAYRLAPEHRLPAAYDDLRAALRWLSNPDARQHLLASADLSRLFIMGDSAGGNIIHNVLASNEGPKLPGLKGVVLLQPFYSSEERTESEKASDEQGFLTVKIADACWVLARPESNEPRTRDHPFCCPPAEGLPDVAVMVVTGGRDVLSDRSVLLTAELKKLGREAVELHVFPEEEHAFYLPSQEREALTELMGLISKFVSRF
ncbi:probable carboxylesterase 15 [Nymphaea colorata]|uniref:probable carboxylesterase 15 n=1 Tax=Nymphaea colorata TaxID=210225 RepID=UPI00129D8BF2|nr:probable carboxylesterase 15 [Nymphaea colorata]